MDVIPIFCKSVTNENYFHDEYKPWMAWYYLFKLNNK